MKCVGSNKTACKSTSKWKAFILRQGSQTRGPRGRFVRPAMLFGNFQMINIFIARCLEKRCREVIESKLNDAQCGFRPSRSTTDQIFALHWIFVISWECGKDVYTCFADLLEKACDRVPRERPWSTQSFSRFGFVTAFLLRSSCPYRES